MQLLVLQEIHKLLILIKLVYYYSGLSLKYQMELYYTTE